MKKLIPLAILVLCVCQAAHATIRYVRASGGSNTAPYTSWASASSNFQDAINASSAGDYVYVAAGTYLPASGQSFSMKEGVKILGGFPAAGGSLAQRDWKIYSSILRGNGSRVFANIDNGLTAEAMLDGFTIEGGASTFGGGMYNLKASPTIRHCIFLHNVALASEGNAMLNDRSSPSISYCIFSANGNDHGAAIFSDQSDISIVNCLFTGNLVSICVRSRSSDFLTITNCIFSGNSGYAILTEQGLITVLNSIIYGNRSGIGGGYEVAISISNSLVQGMPGGSNGNIDGSTNPLFVDAPINTTAPFTGGDYRLQRCSPAINAGGNSWLGVNNTLDLAGKPRIYDGTVDMGAYEFQSPTAYTTYYKDADGDGYGGGNGQPFCINPGTGWALQAGDCDDSNPTINPGATEICGNRIDDNCNGIIDEGCGNCPMPQGDWKNNTSYWPYTALPMMLGTSHLYSQADLLNLLNTATKGDASLILASQLIAAKLNVANGVATSQTILDAITAADAAIGNQSLPAKVKTNTTLGKTMISLAATLEEYNVGMFNPECGGGSQTITQAAKLEPAAIATTPTVENYPNPFGTVTSIRYTLPADAQVNLAVFTPQGQKIVTLVNGKQTAGTHRVQFDGSAKGAGMYLYQLQTVDASGKAITISGKMLLAR